MGVSLITIGQSLYQALKLDPPFSTILIYGGSTATGTMALSGYTMITTCSVPQHEGLGGESWHRLCLIIVSRMFRSVFER